MSFVKFAVALVVLIMILALIGEPYSTWLAGVIVLGAIYMDVQKNGNESLLQSVLQS